ncbi:hypothetical protein E1301_Tti007094 [Triplophysa tibetana]|uniref:BED-type domain-containing protein n=1 Tax=Triplophysa tibetana TaxID=1572043 RepID=A0A5A9PK01_9TELE|nr:hypothetical protein E1301_Tti007094 [Triplophysa tibetana]
MLKVIDRQTAVSTSSDWLNNRLLQSVYLCAVYTAQGCHREREPGLIRKTSGLKQQHLIRIHTGRALLAPPADIGAKPPRLPEFVFRGFSVTSVKVFFMITGYKEKSFAYMPKMQIKRLQISKRHEKVMSQWEIQTIKGIELEGIYSSFVCCVSIENTVCQALPPTVRHNMTFRYQSTPWSDLDTMDEEDAAGPSRECANPWPHLDRLFNFSEQVNDSFRFKCLLCLPKQNFITAYTNSSSNLRKHVKRKHETHLEEYCQLTSTACKRPSEGGTGFKAKQLKLLETKQRSVTTLFAGKFYRVPAHRYTPANTRTSFPELLGLTRFTSAPLCLRSVFLAIVQNEHSPGDESASFICASFICPNSRCLPDSSVHTKAILNIESPVSLEKRVAVMFYNLANKVEFHDVLALGHIRPPMCPGIAVKNQQSSCRQTFGKARRENLQEERFV